MTHGRFSFPGFTLIRREDTPTHEVEIGTVNVDDTLVVVHMIRRANLPFEAKFLIARVFDAHEEELLWEFTRHSFNGLVLLARAEGDAILSFVPKGHDGAITEIISLSAMLRHIQLNIRRTIQLKQQAAQFLEQNYLLSSAERMVTERDARRHRERVQEARHAAFNERQQARIEAVQRILKRGDACAYTNEGQRRFGLPVVGDEWMSLSNKTCVIRVESFDDDTGDVGAALEFFRVIKEKGKNPLKGNPIPVTWNAPLVSTEDEGPEPVDSLVIETEDDEAFAVAVYNSMDDIRTVRSRGLNNGSLVTAKDKVIDGKYEIFSIHADTITTIGMFPPLS